jgi:uncharacterized protein YndB with AHSA1/START domain
MDPVKPPSAKKAKRPETESLKREIEVAAAPEDVWPYLEKVEDWGSWCDKVTEVEPGAGLSPGAQIQWQWEEKEVASVILEVKEYERFSFRSCASSSKAILHWRLQPKVGGGTRVSLRAEVPYGTASSIMDKLTLELNEWISALQTALESAQ